MKQLKMFWKRQSPTPVSLPTGFSVSTFNGSDEDINHWVEICKNGLVGDDATHQSFIDSMVNREDLEMDNIFFIVYDGIPMATVTPIIHKNATPVYAHVHMVSCKTCFRGKGIGTALINLAMNFIYNANCEYAILTTDDFRVSAVKSYLTAGFVPVLYDDDMEERWGNMLRTLKISSIQAVDDNGVFVKNITA